ncbi:hypothetical protein [Sphingomonas sp. TREG-RG-20F-R18-01]|uniref:hypothetical protein n=1 Tax=Sphingomonas sp. TREG-RG-20F-R18-01 TaxID=2914982 RepID=UPI001F57C230|nr:hypothetical protein [Sphingomonas sp. TREG-RG-20F-R18-01]
MFEIRPALHFVGFRGSEYHSAVGVWGKPDFFHMGWDRRAQRDVHPDDTVIFAQGTEDSPVARFNYSDLVGMP